MIVFDGSTGSLGRYLPEALARQAAAGRALVSRLEDRESRQQELAALEVESGAPVCLVQLAARVSVPECERDPEAAYRINVDAVAAAVEDFAHWAEARGHRPGVVYVSTGHVYAVSSHGTRLSEGAPLAPRSTYGKSKARAEQRLSELCERMGVRLSIARVFGLIAPRQPPNYVLPGLLQRARRKDLAAVPGAGCVRDYLDSRDVCRILVELAGRTLSGAHLPGILNVCSGEGVSIRAILEQILRLMYRDEADELLGRIGEAPGRPDDIPWIVGDPTNLTQVIDDDARHLCLSQTIADALHAS